MAKLISLFDTWQVLDSELRVRGVGALRVVDASAMPSIIGGQVTAHTIPAHNLLAS